MSDYSSSGSFALIGGVMSFFYLLIIIVFIVAWWKIFEKAGKPGWASLIPFYNTWVMCEILWPNGSSWMYFVGLFIPVVNFIVAIILMFRLAKAFGKDVLFTVGLILLAPIFILILAFGNSEYDASVL